MAEYLIKSETMQAIADPIKEMSGIETRITPAQVGAAAEEANTEVGTQADLMRQILTALNGKSAGEGGLTLPTLTNPGTADDLAKNKELIDENGNIVTGSVTTYDSHTGWTNRTPSVDGENVKLTVTTNTPYLFRKGVYMKSPLSNFGDATAEDVAVGKTFTSANGLKVEGKHECSGGVDTSDATAIAGDIRWNKTAWVNGEKITGTLSESSIVFAMNLTPTESSDSITLTRHIDSDCIILGGTDINCSANKSEFGDAQPSDVAKGKTFTSASGLLVEGTNEGETGVVLPALENPGSASDLAEGMELIDAKGNIVTGNIPVSGGQSIMGMDVTVSGSNIRLWKIDAFTEKTIMEDGAYLGAYSPLSNFGNAVAADVAKGKTFTSSAGLLVEGEMETSGGYTSGDIVKGWQETNVTVASGSSTSAKINYGSELTHTNGTIAFAGTTGSATVSSVSVLENYKGQYIQRSSSYGTSTYGIYYIPEDAVFSSSGSSYNITYTVDKAHQMFVLA